MKRTLAGMLLGILLAGPMAWASDWYLKKGHIVCTTKAAIHEQMQYLAHDVNEAVNGCGVTDERYRVVPLDINVFDYNKVRIIELKGNVWAAHEALELERDTPKTRP